MKIISRVNLQRSAWVPVALILWGLLFGTGFSGAADLFSCSSPPGTNGDWSDRGFYIPSFPGASIDSVRLKVSGFTAGTYKLSLTVRSNAYDGPILGTSTVSISLSGSGSEQKPATFLYPSVRIAKNSRVCFALAVVSGPYTLVYYAIGGGCAGVIETEDTTPPLSSWRRDGVDILVTGANSLPVIPGWSIQAAIDAALPGETVSVAPGTYHESLTLKSGVNVIGSGFNSTFLEGIRSNSVVTAWTVTNSQFEGFQITGGGTNSYDSGVMIWGGNLMLNNNRILGNSNGIWIVAGSSAIVRNNVVQGNGNPPGSQDSYGILCDNASPLIANNLVISNRTVGLRFNRSIASGAQVINNTIVGNQPYGILCETDATPMIKNNIVVGNGTGMAAYNLPPATSFNDVWNNSVANYAGGAAAGPGSLSADPRFNASALVLYALSVGSPCIDTGDPDPIFNDGDGTRSDMGAYGGPSGINPGTVSGLATGFLFNNIGKIPCSEISPSGSLAGLANVSASIASSLYIYPFKDAPFGGYPWIYGLFGSEDTAVRYYQILAAKWNGGTPPNLTNFVPVLDPLTKIKYTIGTNGIVTATPVMVGPDANGLYLRTDRPDSGYWTFPDLKLILNSRRLENGRYDFICKSYATNNPASEVALPANQLSRITLWIDNNPVTATIASVRNRLGSIIPECGIISVADPAEQLQFEITAYHPSGFLESYILSSRYGRNRYGGYVAAEQYVGSHDTARPFWQGIGPGTQITNSLPAYAAGALAPWQTCAYQFHLEVYARTIDGFNRVYGASFDDHYYINVGSVVSACLGDLNGDGRVDGADLAIFAARYGTNCAVGAPSGMSAPSTPSVNR
jgi:hypothetical protein